MSTIRCTLYMKQGCHLCEEAMADLKRLKARHPHVVDLVDIGADEHLLAQYGQRIPVLSVGGREYDAPLPPVVLEHALAEAAVERSRP